MSIQPNCCISSSSIQKDLILGCILGQKKTQAIIVDHSEAGLFHLSPQRPRGFLVSGILSYFRVGNKSQKPSEASPQSDQAGYVTIKTIAGSFPLPQPLPPGADLYPQMRGARGAEADDFWVVPSGGKDYEKHSLSSSVQAWGCFRESPCVIDIRSAYIGHEELRILPTPPQRADARHPVTLATDVPAQFSDPQNGLLHGGRSCLLGRGFVFDTGYLRPPFIFRKDLGARQFSRSLRA